MFGNRIAHLLREADLGNADLPAGLHQPREVTEIMVIGAVIDERIDGDDGVEKLDSERQRPRIGLDRKHAISNTGIANSLKVFRRAEPQVGSPDLHAKFAV